MESKGAEGLDMGAEHRVVSDRSIASARLADKSKSWRTKITCGEGWGMR
jgi:hypothetical protein